MEKDFICQCKEVTRQDIENLVKKHKVHTVEDLQQLTGAGTGCGRCYSLLEELTNELVARYPDPQLLIPFSFNLEEVEEEFKPVEEEIVAEVEQRQQLSLF